MSLEAFGSVKNYQALNSDKFLITNMNTNNSFTLSQTQGEMYRQVNDKKHWLNKTKQGMLSEQQHYELGLNSNTKLDQPARASNKNPNYQISRNDVAFIINSLKMVLFLSERNENMEQYIQKKAITIKKLNNEVNRLQTEVKDQRQSYLRRFTAYTSLSQRLKRQRKKFSKRIKTDVNEIKVKINQIKKRSSVYQTFRTMSTTKQVQTKRRNQRIFTDYSEDKRIFVPLPYYHHNPGFTERCVLKAYQTLPIRRASLTTDHYLTPKTFQRSGTENLIPRNFERIQNPENFIKIQHSYEQQNSPRSSQPKNENLFNILGRHFIVPPTINTIQSLTAEKTDESIIDPLVAISKQKDINALKSEQSRSLNSSIIDQRSVKLVYDGHSSNISSIKSKPESNKQSVFKFVPSANDFKIVNMGDSVESQYTETQRFQTLNRGKKFQKSQVSIKHSDSNSESYQENDDIIQSIKLTSHSKIFKQKLSESKYLPCFDDPSKYVQNSDLLEMNLLAESNISSKRVSNSKIIKMRLDSLKQESKVGERQSELFNLSSQYNQDKFSKNSKRNH